MQVRGYCNQNNLDISDVLEALKGQFKSISWIPSKNLKEDHINYLDLTFGLSQPQLLVPQEQLQLPASESEASQLQTTIPTGDLVQHLQAHSTDLTATDVEALQATVQTSIIEEKAQIAAIRDFQSYQTTYADTTRTLVVNDIYQKLDTRNLARKQFEEQQNQLAAEKTNTEKSSDLMSEMLAILKTDQFKSEFLISKLEQI